MPFTTDTARLHGGKGGRATATRHRDQLREWGQRGFRATVEQRRVDSDGNLWSPYSWLLYKLHGKKVRQNRSGRQ